MKNLRFFDNTGGMNLRANEVSLAHGEAEEIVNMHALHEGSWSTANTGYVNLYDAPLAGGAPVHALYEYVTLSGQSFLMANAGGSLYTIEPATGAETLMQNEFNPSHPMHFVTFNGLLIGCNGADAPFKWDSENPVATLEGWPATITGVTPGMPAFSEIFANRLVFSGDATNPSMIYISELENPENFTPDTGATSAGAIQVSPGDGERITALKTLFLPAINEEILVIFKERSTYLLIGSDAETFMLQKISDEFGAVSAKSAIVVGNELMFLSHEGVTLLSTSTTQGNLTTGFLSDSIRPLIDKLNRDRLSGSFAVHLRNRQEVWWFVPEGSATQNQTVLVYNYGIKRAWSKRTGIWGASGLSVNGQLYTGNYQGFIQHQLKGNSYNNQPIPWTYRTGFMDLSAPRIRKRIKDIQVFLRQVANVDVTVNFYWDFRRSSKHRQSHAISVNPDSASSIFGATRYGEDYYNLSGSSIFKLIPAGSGRYFQIEFTGQTAGKPLELEGWIITAIYGGYR